MCASFAYDRFCPEVTTAVPPCKLTLPDKPTPKAREALFVDLQQKFLQLWTSDYAEDFDAAETRHDLETMHQLWSKAAETFLLRLCTYNWE